jgi:transcription initiation factor TFIID subunit 8
MDEYSRQIARVAVAQIAEMTGYDAVHESAIEVLAQILLNYVAELCTSSHSYAQLATRADFNAADVVMALEDVGTSVRDLSEYVAKQVSPTSRV